MATVRAVAELVYRMFEGGSVSDDAAFENIDFEQAVQAARAYKIKLDYWQGMKMEGERYINSTWLETFTDVPVLLNEKTNTYYSVLPRQVFGDLPKGRGFNLCCPMQAPESPFMPMNYGEVWLFTNLPQDQCYYTFDIQNVYYFRFDQTVKSVFMQYIPLTSDFIPDECVFEIRDLTLNQFLKVKQIPMDKVDDQNPNITQVNTK